MNEELGSLPKRPTPPEVETARKTLQSLYGIVRVDREGIGYADVAIGVPANMVAGARCPSYTRNASACSK